VADSLAAWVHELRDAEEEVVEHVYTKERDAQEDLVQLISYCNAPVGVHLSDLDPTEKGAGTQQREDHFNDQRCPLACAPQRVILGQLVLHYVQLQAKIISDVHGPE
jgi:hypothetical protein